MSKENEEGDKEDGDENDGVDNIEDQALEERYIKCDDEICRGSFKTVFKGLDRKTGAAVAWCQLGEDKSLSEEERSRFYEDADVQKGLQHPNVFRFYDCWDMVQQSEMADPKKSIVMITELMAGGTVKTYLKRFKKLDPQLLRSWSRQILSGLLFLHTMKPAVIHRDLKCSNIFITDGSVKIGDLGQVSLKNKSEFIYKEQYDETVDVYFYGLCMLEMATGECPYSECSGPAQIYKSVVNGVKPKSLEKVENGEVREIIEQCMYLRKENRPRVKEILAKKFFTEEREALAFEVNI